MNKPAANPITKKSSRAHFRQIRKEISIESKCLLDSALFSNIASHPEFLNAKTVLCYYPVKSEPNILPLIRHALLKGKKVAFPISHPESSTLTFHVVDSLSDLSVGTYDIPEPPTDAQQVCDFRNSICIVPALAYDGKGNRLGYGRGYYDRFLKDFDGVSVLPIYSLLFSDLLPTDENDQKVDIIITEEGVAYVNERKHE